MAGQVVDRATRHPITGAQVVLSVSSPDREARTQTDQDGRFHFPGFRHVEFVVLPYAMYRAPTGYLRVEAVRLPTLQPQRVLRQRRRPGLLPPERLGRSAAGARLVGPQRQAISDGCRNHDRLRPILQAGAMTACDQPCPACTPRSAQLGRHDADLRTARLDERCRRRNLRELRQRLRPRSQRELHHHTFYGASMIGPRHLTTWYVFATDGDA